MLEHRPNVEDPFRPGRLERRVRELLAGLHVQWRYPEHAGRLQAILDLLAQSPVPGVRYRHRPGGGGGAWRSGQQLRARAPARTRGFCLFNNVAVVAAHAQAELDCPRVLIIDWDAHHGNGTQDICWADPDVLFFDIRRAVPFYPGTGNLDEVGAGLGGAREPGEAPECGVAEVAAAQFQRDAFEAPD